MRRFAVIWAAILLLTFVVALTAHRAFTSQARQNAAVRESWCYVEKKILANPRITKAEARKTVAFFHGLTHDLNVAPCVITLPKGGSNA